MNRYTAIVLLIVLLITTTILASFFSFRNARRAAEDFLKSQALGIAASLDTTLARYGTRDNIFTDLIQSEQWEGIAYLALYAENGSILLHSNKNLIGRKWEDPVVRKAFVSGETSYTHRTLGTGENVFLMDTALHFGKSEDILRVALHTYPSQKIIRQARLQFMTTAAAVSVLSVLTIFFIMSVKKREALEKTLLEKEKLSMLGEMSAVLAHEIRNPLGSIKGCAQYLRELNDRKGSGGEESGYFDVMVSESLRLERLTEDMLCYAREYSLEQETFGLSELIAEVTSSLSIPASATVNSLVESGLAVTSDRGKVRQVMVNLIQNALDSLSEGGSVMIMAEEKGENVLLEIRDTGSGIDEEARSRVFRPFFTTKAKGTGLGLAIVDRYVAALGGKIDFESTVGKGSIFTVSIPADTARRKRSEKHA